MAFVLEEKKPRYVLEPGPEAFDPTEGMSGYDKFMAGAGKGMTDLARGAGQALGIVSNKDIEKYRAIDAPLMNTGFGQFGNVIGQAATIAPMALIPGANSYAGASVLGGLTGAAQPVANGESRLANTGFGAAGGVVGQKIGNSISNFIGNKVATNAANKVKNSVIDETLRNSQNAGYVVPPSQAGAGFLSRSIEGLSGKYKTNQLASIKNQKITDGLTRQAFGLPEDAPLTRDVMQSIRNKSYAEGYEPVKSFGVIRTDNNFNEALNNIVKDYQGAAKSFPGIPDDVSKLVDGFKVNSFDSGSAIDATKVLREQANKAYASGDKAMGGAYKKLSKAIEDQIERGLSTPQISDDALSQFMPKTPDLSGAPKDDVTRYFGTLKNMANNAGWSEKGGRIIRDMKTGEVKGRTKWVAKDPAWFTAGMGEDEVKTAVNKFTSGQKLTKKEQSTINYMLDFAKQNDPNVLDIPAVDMSGMAGARNYDEMLKGVAPLSEPPSAPFPGSIDAATWKSGKEKAAKEMLDNFRNARQTMAKTYDIESAIREGGGIVSAPKLAAKLQKGKPLAGELRTIGEFANNFGNVAKIPESGFANPFTIFDYAGSALGYGVNPYAAALPLGRVASRYSILSPAYQKAFVHPSYGGMVTNGAEKITPLLQQYGGLLGGIAGSQ